MTTNIQKIRNLSNRHRALSMVLSGYSREAIKDELGISEESLSSMLSSIARELDTELNDLRENILAVSIFRLEDLIQRNYAILDMMDKSADPERRGSADTGQGTSLSVRDYVGVSKNIADLIQRQINLLSPSEAGRPSKNGMPDMVDGVAKAAATSPATTIQETDDIYLAFLQQIAEDIEGETVSSVPETEG